MESSEAVLLAVAWLLKKHHTALLNAEQVAMSFVPKSGHGDDIWLRAENLHVVAEVTTSGADKTWGALNPKVRQRINEKLHALADCRGATHRYLFVVGPRLASALAAGAPGGVNVVDLTSVP